MMRNFSLGKHHRKRLLIGAGLSVALALLVGNLLLPLPRHLQGSLYATGRVVDCDFARLGSRGSEVFFVGLRLDAPDAPYLRANPKHEEKPFYVSLCGNGDKKVAVRYHAKDRIFGPVRFWIQSVHVVQEG